MSRLRKKSTITAIIIIGVCAILVLNNYTTMVLAWDDEEITAPIGEIPIIDGKQDGVWSGSNVTQSTNPALTMKVMINGSYLFVLIEVRSENHNDDEYIKLLLSNSTDSETEDFFDAKLIQTRNFSSSENRSYNFTDQHYNISSSSYIDDSDRNFLGAANVSTSGNKYSYYEFRLPTSSTVDFDFANDTAIEFTKSYAIKVVFGSHEEGEDPTESFTTSIILLFKQGEGEETTTPFPINLDVVSYIVFSIVGAAFVVIIVLTYQSRSKV